MGDRPSILTDVCDVDGGALVVSTDLTGQPEASGWYFDASTATWSVVPPPPLEVSPARGLSTGESFLLFNLDTPLSYSPATAQWKVLEGHGITGQAVWTGDRAIVQNNDEDGDALVLEEFVPVPRPTSTTGPGD